MYGNNLEENPSLLCHRDSNRGARPHLQCAYGFQSTEGGVQCCCHPGCSPMPQTWTSLEQRFAEIEILQGIWESCQCPFIAWTLQCLLDCSQRQLEELLLQMVHKLFLMQQIYSLTKKDICSFSSLFSCGWHKLILISRLSSLLLAKGQILAGNILSLPKE